MQSPTLTEAEEQDLKAVVQEGLWELQVQWQWLQQSCVSKATKKQEDNTKQVKNTARKTTNNPSGYVKSESNKYKLRSESIGGAETPIIERASRSYDQLRNVEEKYKIGTSKHMQHLEPFVSELSKSMEQAVKYTAIVAAKGIATLNDKTDSLLSKVPKPTVSKPTETNNLPELNQQNNTVPNNTTDFNETSETENVSKYEYLQRELKQPDYITRMWLEQCDKDQGWNCNKTNYNEGCRNRIDYHLQQRMYHTGINNENVNIVPSEILFQQSRPLCNCNTMLSPGRYNQHETNINERDGYYRENHYQFPQCTWNENINAEQVCCELVQSGKCSSSMWEQHHQYPVPFCELIQHTGHHSMPINIENNQSGSVYSYQTIMMMLDEHNYRLLQTSDEMLGCQRSLLEAVMALQRVPIKAWMHWLDEILGMITATLKSSSGFSALVWQTSVVIEHCSTIDTTVMENSKRQHNQNKQPQPLSKRERFDYKEQASYPTSRYYGLNHNYGDSSGCTNRTSVNRNSSNTCQCHHRFVAKCLSNRELQINVNRESLRSDRTRHKKFHHPFPMPKIEDLENALDFGVLHHMGYLYAEVLCKAHQLGVKLAMIQFDIEKEKNDFSDKATNRNVATFFRKRNRQHQFKNSSDMNIVGVHRFKLGQKQNNKSQQKKANEVTRNTTEITVALPVSNTKQPTVFAVAPGDGTLILINQLERSEYDSQDNRSETYQTIPIKRSEHEYTEQEYQNHSNVSVNIKTENSLSSSDDDLKFTNEATTELAGDSENKERANNEDAPSGTSVFDITLKSETNLPRAVNDESAKDFTPLTEIETTVYPQSSISSSCNAFSDDELASVSSIDSHSCGLHEIVQPASSNNTAEQGSSIRETEISFSFMCETASSVSCSASEDVIYDRSEHAIDMTTSAAAVSCSPYFAWPSSENRKASPFCDNRFPPRSWLQLQVEAKRLQSEWQQLTPLLMQTDFISSLLQEKTASDEQVREIRTVLVSLQGSICCCVRQLIREIDTHNARWAAVAGIHATSNMISQQLTKCKAKDDYQCQLKKNNGNKYSKKNIVDVKEELPKNSENPITTEECIAIEVSRVKKVTGNSEDTASDKKYTEATQGHAECSEAESIAADASSEGHLESEWLHGLATADALLQTHRALFLRLLLLANLRSIAALPTLLNKVCQSLLTALQQGQLLVDARPRVTSSLALSNRQSAEQRTSEEERQGNKHTGEGDGGEKVNLVDQTHGNEKKKETNFGIAYSTGDKNMAENETSVTAASLSADGADHHYEEHVVCFHHSAALMTAHQLAIKLLIQRNDSKSVN